MVVYLNEKETAALMVMAARGLVSLAHDFPNLPSAEQIEELANCGAVYCTLTENATDNKSEVKASDPDVNE